MTTGTTSPPPAPAGVSVELRYFAAAAEAAGCLAEQLELPAGTTLTGLRALLTGRSPQMAQVVGASTFLLNAVSSRPEASTTLADGDRVDVLPPFAGG